MRNHICNSSYDGETPESITWASKCYSPCQKKILHLSFYFSFCNKNKNHAIWFNSYGKRSKCKVILKCNLITTKKAKISMARIERNSSSVRKHGLIKEWQITVGDAWRSTSGKCLTFLILTLLFCVIFALLLIIIMKISLMLVSQKVEEFSQQQFTIPKSVTVDNQNISEITEENQTLLQELVWPFEDNKLKLMGGYLVEVNVPPLPIDVNEWFSDTSNISIPVGGTVIIKSSNRSVWPDIGVDFRFSFFVRPCTIFGVPIWAAMDHRVSLKFKNGCTYEIAKNVSCSSMTIWNLLLPTYYIVGVEEFERSSETMGNLLVDTIRSHDGTPCLSAELGGNVGRYRNLQLVHLNDSSSTGIWCGRHLD